MANSPKTNRRGTRSAKRTKPKVDPIGGGLRSAFDYAPIGMALVSVDGNCLEVNPRLCELLGYCSEELELKPIQDIISPIQDGSIANPLKNGNRFVSVETCLTRKNKSLVWSKVTISLVQNRYNRPSYYIYAVEDISDKIRMQRELLELKQGASAVIANAPIKHWATNGEGQIVFYDGKVSKTIGIEPADRIGKNVIEVYQGQPEVIDCIQSAMVGTPSSCESCWKQTWFETHITPKFDESGKICGVVGVSIDITERRRQHQERQKWEQFFKWVHSGMVVASPNKVLLDVNPAFKQMHGFLSDEWTGSSLLDLISPESKKSFLEFEQRVEETGHVTYETTHKRKNGTTFPVFADLSMIKDQNGVPLYLVAHFIDLSESKKVQNDLRNSELRFRKLYESSLFGMVFWDKGGCIVDANDTFLRTVGYSRSELIARDITWNRITPVEFQKTNQQALDELNRFGFCRPFETELILKNKTRMPVLIGGATLPDEALGLGMAFVLDITDKSNAEKTIRQSEERFKQLANSMPQIVWTAKADGYVNYYNERWYELTGLPRDQSGDESWSSVLHPEDVDRCHNTWYESVRSGKPYQIECRFLDRRTGNYRWFLGRALPAHDAQGRIQSWFGTSTDIHDQKSMTEALRFALKDSSDLKLALDRSSILAVTDRRGVITYVNDKFCEISKYSREELIGKTHRIINSDYHSREFFQDLWLTISKGQIWRHEVRNRAKDGTIYWVDTVIVPFLDENNRPYQYTAIHSDITERKKNEHDRAQLLAREHAALEGSRLKSEFLANMTHEIRTPLNSVVGMTDLLLDTNLSPEQYEYATVIKTSTRTLIDLISDILDFSKIESGKLELETIPFNVKEIIAEVEQQFRWPAQNKGIQLIVEDLVTTPPTLIGDPTKLRQVITNILSNGIKFTQQGSVTLRAKILSEDQRRIELQIEVQDTGIGINELGVSRLFEPFVQSDSSTTRRYGGTGLGLSICKKLVEAMGGKLGVESMLGHGSCFWFRTTFEKAKNAEEPFALLGEAPLKAAYPGRSILFVEDSVANQRVMTLMLSKFGINAEVVSSGREALDILELKHFDLILMDCHMPEMDGYEATRLIRAHSDLTIANTRIIAVTASAISGDRETCLAAGMNDFLPKPVNKEALTNCLQKWLGPYENRASSPLTDTGNTGQHTGSIDWEKIKSLNELDPNGNSNLVAEMVNLFSKNVPKRIEAIKKATESRDWLAIQKEAHGLRSSTCYLGAVRLEELCRTLEELAKNHNADQISKIQDDLDFEYRNVLRLLC